MKNRVVIFCTLPLVAPSQKSTYFDPLRAPEKWEMHFLCGNWKNTSCKSGWECKDAYLHQKWDHVPKFAVELAQTMVICQGRPRELVSGSTSL
jgi:hypothetical protein